MSNSNFLDVSSPAGLFLFLSVFFFLVGYSCFLSIFDGGHRPRPHPGLPRAKTPHIRILSMSSMDIVRSDF